MAVIINGSAGVTTNAGGSVNPSTNVEGINFSCRAFVNFNGTGTVAIRASGNVSSITDIATGRYTINFTTAMPDTNYSVTASASSTNTHAALAVQIFAGTPWSVSAPTTSSFSIVTPVSTTNATDLEYVCLSIFR
jgi:hypothetical protein